MLASFDLVVASLHVSRRQPRADLTRRTLNAIRSPHVDVIAHPAGRMLGGRDDLDLDWDQVYAAAARTGTALEINGSPHRLDLAVGAGSTGRRRRLRALDRSRMRTRPTNSTYVRWGVSQARRAWVRAEDVLNTRDRDALLAWVAGKPGRT